MCFHYALYKEKSDLEKRYDARFTQGTLFSPAHYINGFSHPKLPVITNQEPKILNSFSWGLIPYWVNEHTQAKKISQSTLNARSESIFTKASFREAIVKRRAIIPANGFFEWQLSEGKKIPYYIYLDDLDTFSFAGIWEEWKNTIDNTTQYTFSVITTKANPFMEEIHNTKKRMPLILTQDEEQSWLSELSKDQINAILRGNKKINFIAHRINKITPNIHNLTFNSNIIKPYNKKYLF